MLRFRNVGLSNLNNCISDPLIGSLDVSSVAILVLDLPISEQEPTLTKVEETISKLKGCIAAGIP